MGVFRRLCALARQYYWYVRFLLWRKIRSYQTPSESKISELPPELLLAIFRYAMDPDMPKFNGRELIPVKPVFLQVYRDGQPRRPKWDCMKCLFYFRSVDKKWRSVIDNCSDFRIALFMEPPNPDKRPALIPYGHFSFSYNVHYPHKQFGERYVDDPFSSWYLSPMKYNEQFFAQDQYRPPALHPILDSIHKWGEFIHRVMMRWWVTLLEWDESQSICFRSIMYDLNSMLWKYSRDPPTEGIKCIWLDMHATMPPCRQLRLDLKYFRNQWYMAYEDGDDCLKDVRGPGLEQRIAIVEKVRGEVSQ